MDVGTVVVPGDFGTYTHPRSVFTISVPRTWGLQEPAAPSGVVRTFFRAPNNDIVLGITVLNAAPTTTVEEGAKMLQSLVESGFSDAEEFEVQGAPAAQDDGSQRMAFTFSHSESGRKTTYIGNAFAQLDNTKLSVIFVVKTALSQGQEDPRDSIITAVLNSYRVDPAASLP